MEECRTSEPTAAGYKHTCFRLGLFLTAIMLIREIASGISPLLLPVISGMNPTARYALILGYSSLCVQIIPSVLAVLMLKYSFKNLLGGLHVPKQNKKALANFPAVYGAAMTVNLITMSVIYLMTKSGSINDAVNPMTSIQPPDLPSAAVLFVMLAVIAPIFEEFVFRGAILNLLKPYGGGMAIFVSAFCFGIYHGNFQQFFYTFVFGIALGYIAYATNSIFSTTVLHALFNSISGILMFFVCAEPIQLSAADPEAVLTDGQQLVVSLYYIFMVIVLLTAIVGFIAMINKLRHIKRFRVPVVWNEMTNRRKLLLMVTSVPIITAILLMIDIMGPELITGRLMQLTGSFMNGAVNLF